MTDGNTGDAPERPEEGDGWEWAIVEIFGHRRHAGRIREEERFGAKMLRVDELVIDRHGERWETRFYGGSSIFSLTPTDERTVRRAAPREVVVGLVTLPAPDEDEDGEMLP